MQYGSENKRKSPAPFAITLCQADAATLASFKQVPGDLKSARAKAANSDFIKKHIPDPILDAYCNK